jgi:hypothetical protein
MSHFSNNGNEDLRLIIESLDDAKRILNNLFNKRINIPSS